MPQRNRYFGSGALRARLRKLLEVECMSIADAAEEMKIPPEVVRQAAKRYGITYHKQRTFWTEEENTTLIQTFRLLLRNLPNKTPRQIVNRLGNVHEKWGKK